MVWNPPKILSELRRLHKSGSNLSYTALSRRKQSLVSAAAYHFGSYRHAVQQAGIDYAQVLRRPRWTKLRIIKLIKQARRAGTDLHWSAVTAGGNELSKAAFASLQPRLFGRWATALVAAGLDADEISLYHRWDRHEIVYELRCRHREGMPMNSGAVQKELPGLHAAAVRHFGSHDRALKAAAIDPAAARLRRHWTRAAVTAAIKSAAKSKQSLSDSAVRRRFSPLYGAATRLFGSFTAARKAAGVSGPTRA
jgi:hypothetical protein